MIHAAADSPSYVRGVPLQYDCSLTVARGRRARVTLPWLLCDPWLQHHEASIPSYLALRHPVLLFNKRLPVQRMYEDDDIVPMAPGVRTYARPSRYKVRELDVLDVAMSLCGCDHLAVYRSTQVYPGHVQVLKFG